MSERQPSGISGPPSRSNLSRKAVDLAKNLLSSLFMAIRTAKIHDPSNSAFENAVQSVFRSSEALFQATGGFSIQFVEDTIFVNGTRLRFESTAFSTMRTLRRLMEAEDLGGLELLRPPNQTTIRNLILVFSPSAKPDPERQASLAQDIKMLSVQRLVDDRPDIKVDRRVFAVQCYGKLLLAVREQVTRIAEARSCDWTTDTAPPRLRIVRVVQDLVELGADRADFLLRLATNQQGAKPIELHGANVCLLAISMGTALGLERQILVDIAVAALFHHIGAVCGPQGDFTWDTRVSHASLARLLSETGVGQSSYLRALMVGEQSLVQRGGAVGSHPFSRLIKVAAAFDRWVTGFGYNEVPLHPLGALARAYNADPGDLDRNIVDLLINVLRAFPVGCRVVLDSGETAVVTNQLGGARWDRPMVRTEGADPRILDLSLRVGGRFAGRIAATARFAGHDPSLESPLDESAVPVLQVATDLSDLLEGEDVFPDDLELEAYPLELDDEPLARDALDDGAEAWTAPMTPEPFAPQDLVPEPLAADALSFAPNVGGVEPWPTDPMTLDAAPEPLTFGALQPLELPADALQSAPDALLPSEQPADLSWSALVPDAFENSSDFVGLDIPQPPQPVAADPAVLRRLERLPATHTDTFDEEDEPDDTLGG